MITSRPIPGKKKDKTGKNILIINKMGFQVCEGKPSNVNLINEAGASSHPVLAAIFLIGPQVQCMSDTWQRSLI